MARRDLSILRHRGFSLVELTVALAIFSTGLGGFSLLMMLAIQGSSASRLQSIAAIEAASLANRLRLVPGITIHQSSIDAGPPCQNGSYCAPLQMAGFLLDDWQRGLEYRIPGSVGVLCADSTPDDGRVDWPACDGLGSTVIKLFWTEPGREDKGAPRHRRLVTLLPLL